MTPSQKEDHRAAPGEPGAELIKSMMSFSWAMALFGARQMGSLLSAASGDTAAAFGSVARSATDQFGPLARDLWRTADRLQAGLIDVGFTATPAWLDRPTLAPMGLGLLQGAASAVTTMLPAHGRIPWQESQNKVEAFRCFESAAALLSKASSSRAGLMALQEALATTWSRGEPYGALWTTEGLGYAYAQSSWRGEEAPRRLLAKARLDAVPARSLLALHTGMGLAFARRTLAASSPELRTRLEDFLTLCRDSSAAGLEEATFEALGLIARILHPHLLSRLDHHLAEMDPLLAEYFWHGVGRGLYFVPTHVLPFSGWRAVDKPRREAPDEHGRRNALAGLAWALTLVNIRHPVILEAFVRRHAGELGGDDAFSHGVVAALVVWHDAVGSDRYLRRFLAHEPDPADPRTAELWNEWVRRPGEHGVRQIPAFHDRLGGLFRYRPLAELGEPDGNMLNTE